MTRKAVADTKPETALILMGCSAAALSACFGIYSVAMSQRSPTISGNEHLLIFTRPALARQSEPAALAANQETINPLETDPITTGSIRAKRPLAVPVDSEDQSAKAQHQPRKPIPNFTLRGIFNGKALLQGPDGFVMAGPGTYVRGAGTIRLIEPTRTGWAVTTSEGRIE